MPSDVKVHSLSDIYGRKLSLYHTEERAVEWGQLIFWSWIQKMFHFYTAKPERSRKFAVDQLPPLWIQLLCEMILRVYITVVLHLSGLNGIASHPRMQKIRIIGFFFDNKLHGQFEFSCCYLEYLPSSKAFDLAWFEVVESITLYCTWSDNR